MWKRSVFGAGVHKDSPKPGTSDRESPKDMHQMQEDGEHGSTSEHSGIEENRARVEAKTRAVKGTYKRGRKKRKRRVQGSRQQGWMTDLLERIAYQTSGSALEFQDYLKGVKRDAIRTRGKIQSEANEQGADTVGISGQ